MTTLNIPSEHKELIMAALKMKSSIDEKRDLDSMRRDRLGMLKQRTVGAYTVFRESEDTFNTLIEIIDFLSGKG